MHHNAMLDAMLDAISFPKKQSKADLQIFARERL
jgi:hypothetical protein